MLRLPCGQFGYLNRNEVRSVSAGCSANSDPVSTKSEFRPQLNGICWCFWSQNSWVFFVHHTVLYKIESAVQENLSNCFSEMLEPPGLAPTIRVAKITCLHWWCTVTADSISRMPPHSLDNVSSYRKTNGLMQDHFHILSLKKKCVHYSFNLINFMLFNLPPKWYVGLL